MTSLLSISISSSHVQYGAGSPFRVPPEWRLSQVPSISSPITLRSAFIPYLVRSGHAFLYTPQEPSSIERMIGCSGSVLFPSRYIKRSSDVIVVKPLSLSQIKSCSNSSSDREYSSNSTPSAISASVTK